MNQQTINEGKIMAVISYITAIGLLIAFIVNYDKKNEFVKFHIGQSLRVWILAIVIGLVLRLAATSSGLGLLGLIRWIPLVFAVIGAINANNGKLEKLPYIGTIGE
ncbi:DUF4870 domain-containing protein [Arenibacter aquaticus]|uniref:DUF4870 domain-containing protein n=1 Tax=Arenibacter aquaticus TaxID=2489054 RepID=A0A3S0C481_9FLAO|nr:DUF4870 domain-containing protein [Arenibacter aquaticus]RTE51832.1 DUF4870 domain-containing protein [Arenibacter aquaticus]